MQKMSTMPLYEELAISKEDTDIITNYLNFYGINDDSIDLFCIHCNEHSIFKPSNKQQLPSVGYNSVYVFFKKILPYAALHFVCTRNDSHIFEMQIMHLNDSIMKIGQYPSKADLEAPDWNRYSKVIPSRYLSDIKKAIGLSSHGIGAGSFVYLRRVIEYLIN